MKRPRVVSVEVKRRAVERLAQGESASDVAKDLGINRQRLYEWQDRVRQGGLEALRGKGRPRKGALDSPPLKSALLNEGAAARARIAELERKIGEQQADLDFFRQALRQVRGQRRPSDGPGAGRSTRSSRRR